MKFDRAELSRSKWGRRLLFFGVNLGLAAMVYLGVIAPIQSFLSEGAERIADRQATLARYQSIAMQEGAVRDYAKQVRDGNAQGELLEGNSEGTVNANLQARLKSSAERSGVTVRSIQVLPAKILRGAKLIGARLEVFGKLESVHALSRALEGESPLLLVTAAALRPRVGYLDAATTSDEVLEAQFEIYGGAAPGARP